MERHVQQEPAGVLTVAVPDSKEMHRKKPYDKSCTSMRVQMCKLELRRRVAWTKERIVRVRGREPLLRSGEVADVEHDQVVQQRAPEASGHALSKEGSFSSVLLRKPPRP